MGNRYKFRAECLKDVIDFLDNLWPGGEFRGCLIKKRNKIEHDVEVDLVINRTNLDEIRTAMSIVDDSDVMIASLNYAEKYLDRRYFQNTNARIQALIELRYEESKKL